MRAAVFAAAVAIAGAVAVFAGGCGGSQAVTLGDEWPEKVPDYQDTKDRWTRHDRAYQDVDLVIDAHATLKSPEWRAAYAGAKARQAKLSPAARATLFDEERRAANEFIEIQLIVATHDYPAMDFSSNDSSMWKMTLTGDDGREVAATSVKQDNRARTEISTWFPELSPFHKAYVMRFPKVTADGQPLVTSASSRLELRIGSALGAVKMVWSR